LIQVATDEVRPPLVWKRTITRFVRNRPPGQQLTPGIQPGLPLRAPEFHRLQMEDSANERHDRAVKKLSPDDPRGLEEFVLARRLLLRRVVMQERRTMTEVKTVSRENLVERFPAGADSSSARLPT
jgi:hypothetical protein